MSSEEGLQLGIEISIIKKKILSMDLEKISQSLNSYQTVRPIFHPSEYLVERQMMENLSKVVRILLHTKKELLRLDDS